MDVAAVDYFGLYTVPHQRQLDLGVPFRAVLVFRSAQSWVVCDAKYMPPSQLRKVLYLRSQRLRSGK